MNWNIIEVAQKTLDSLEFQYARGGWHRFAIIFIWGLIIYALVCSVELFGRKK